jgi:hypothetical protein
LSVKKDSRTGVEMVGSLMQATGTMLDWRARAYEVTVFEGATGGRASSLRHRSTQFRTG